MRLVVLGLSMPFALLAPVVGDAQSTKPAPAAKSAPKSAPELVRTVSHEGQRLTVRLKAVGVRAPSFTVLVQQADGSYRTHAAPAARSYLGGVDGKPGAIASGIIASDGAFQGQIVFDRGATWYVRNSEVTSTRGLEPPEEYRWPSATDAKRNVTVAPGQVGSTTYRWDVGFDVDNTWFNAAPVSGSVDRTLDIIEQSAVALLDVYETNARLRPAVGRVIIRASAARDPYAGSTSHGDTLGKLRAEWNDHQKDSDVDDVALLTTEGGGGGMAYIGTAGTTWGSSVNGGAGASIPVLRHELGHTWGPADNHTNGPEGRTIESGNDFHRFDGTELSAILRYRDGKQSGSTPFTPTNTLAIPVPPYAALDLVDKLKGGSVHTVSPIANDHDANGQTLTLKSVAGTSHLGRKVVRSGNQIRYSSATVSTQTLDWVEYVVQDSSGRTATGVALLRVVP